MEDEDEAFLKMLEEKRQELEALENPKREKEKKRKSVTQKKPKKTTNKQKNKREPLYNDPYSPKKMKTDGSPRFAKVSATNERGEVNQVSMTVEVAVEKLSQKKNHAMNEGNVEECLVLQERIVDIHKQVYGANDKRTSKAIANHVKLYINFSSELALSGDIHGAFELCIKAKNEIKKIKQKLTKRALMALVCNNLTNYYVKRKKFKAAVKMAATAYAHWKHLGTMEHSFYFMMIYGTALCLAEEYKKGVSMLKACVKFMNEPALNEEGKPPPVDVTFVEGYENRNGADMATLLNIISHHNLITGYCGARKYKLARDHLENHYEEIRESVDPHHPWRKHIANTAAFLKKMNDVKHTFNHYRINKKEIAHQGMQTRSKVMQKVMKHAHKHDASSKQLSREIFTATASNVKKSIAMTKEEKAKQELQHLFPFIQTEDLELTITSTPRDQQNDEEERPQTKDTHRNDAGDHDIVSHNFDRQPKPYPKKKKKKKKKKKNHY